MVVKMQVEGLHKNIHSQINLWYINPTKEEFSF